VARTTRKAPEGKMSDYEDVIEGVIFSADHKTLEFGVKADGQ
jgi:hypothetical protein